LRLNLVGEYRVNARRNPSSILMMKERLLGLPDVTVRLGVNSYRFGKLKDILARYSGVTTVAETRAIIIQNIDESLDIGQREGGNIIISWDNEIWGYRRWTPSEVS